MLRTSTGAHLGRWYQKTDGFNPGEGAVIPSRQASNPHNVARTTARVLESGPGRSNPDRPSECSTTASAARERYFAVRSRSSSSQFITSGVSKETTVPEERVLHDR